MPVLDEILEACDKNDFSNFRRLFNTYIDDENTYVKFIFEQKINPSLIQTSYTLCKCRPNIITNEYGMNEQLCNCENGKRFILYKYATNGSNIQKYIDKSGPIDTTWKVYMTPTEYQSYLDRLNHTPAYYASDEFLRLFKPL